MLPPLPANMPASLAEAQAIAMKNNPSVQLAMVQLQEAEAKRKVTAAELQPSYQLGLNAQRSTDILNGGGTTNFSTTFGLSVPLYGNRQVSNSKLRQDEIAIRRLREQLSAAQASVEQQVIAAWHQFQTAQAVGQARSSQITASELSLRGAVAESDAGTKTGTDVISAQQSLTAAQVAASNARVDVVQGAYNLVAAMGCSQPAICSFRCGIMCRSASSRTENSIISRLCSTTAKNSSLISDRWLGCASSQ